jgi:hypothetical protein
MNKNTAITVNLPKIITDTDVWQAQELLSTLSLLECFFRIDNSKSPHTFANLINYVMFHKRGMYYEERAKKLIYNAEFEGYITVIGKTNSKEKNDLVEETDLLRKTIVKLARGIKHYYVRHQVGSYSVLQEGDAGR